MPCRRTHLSTRTAAEPTPPTSLDPTEAGGGRRAASRTARLATVGSVTAPVVERRRPRGVTVLVVLGLVQAVFVAALGALLVLARGEPDVRADFEGSEVSLLAAGISFVVVGVLVAGLAVLLSRGSDVARSIYAVVCTFQVASATYSLVALRELFEGAVVGLAIPMVVLWLLYGSAETQRFFER